jgi:hypothetical protein
MMKKAQERGVPRNGTSDILSRSGRRESDREDEAPALM